MQKQIFSRNIDIAIMVISCDKYKDLWTTTLNRINSLAIFNEFDKYLVVNNEDVNFDKWKIIKCGNDISWSNNLLFALNKIKNEYLFLLVEDIYILKIDDNFFLANSINYLEIMDSYYIKLIDIPSTIKVDNFIGKYDVGEPYSISVNGIWRIRELKEILAAGESAWEFEINGSYRSKIYNSTLAFKKEPIQMINLVEKGKWSVGLNKDKLVNLGLDPKSRPFMKINEIIISVLQKYYFHLVIRFKWIYRVKLANLVKKFLVTY